MFAKIQVSEKSEGNAWRHNATGFVLSVHFVHFSVPIEYHIVTPELIWIFDVHNSSKITNFCLEFLNGERQHNGPELKQQYERALPVVTDFLHYQNELLSDKNKIQGDFAVTIELSSEKFFSRIDEILKSVEQFHNSFSDRIKWDQLNEKNPSDKNKALLMLSENRLFLAMKMLERVMDDEEKQSNFMDYLQNTFSIKNENNDVLKIMPLSEFMLKVKVYINKHTS